METARRSNKIYEFADFRLIPGEGLLLRKGEPVPLLPKAFAVLSILVERHGSLVLKSEMIDEVWGDTFVEEAAVAKCVWFARNALGDDKQDFIKTIPKRGYRFVAEVTEHVGNGVAAKENDGGQPEIREEPPPAELTATPPAVSASSRKYVWATAAFLLVVSFLLVAFNAGGLRDQVLGTGESTPIRSLAVLPLENLSGDASQEYFADGMTEALISGLAKIENVRVISRQSVMRYRGEQRPISEIGRELKVDAVLTGSVIRSGDRTRIAVQLVHAATDRSLWSETYERDLSDILVMQNEVARAVASQIRIKLTPQEQVKFGNAVAVDPAAYDEYLRGKFYMHRQTSSNNLAAIGALEKAVAGDSAFAAAHAELALAYVWRLFLFSPGEKELAEKAFVSAEKALSLDPNLAVAYLARGRLLWTPANRFPHDKAIREYRRALELDPNLDEARNQLALVYCHIGAFDAALKELELALETNPGNSLAQFRVGETYLFKGEYEKALTALRDTPKDANPALVGHQMVWALFHLGRTEEAKATLDRYLTEHPEDNRGLFTSLEAVFLATEGKQGEAEEKIREAIEEGQKGFGHFHHTAFHIASAYSLMNNRDEAIKWLENSSEDGFPCWGLFEKDKVLDNVRDDPRFKTLIDNLRQRWESYNVQ